MMSRQAWRLIRILEATLGGSITSADLGGSSKYSNETSED